MREQPDDEFKDLPISNQAKWARRNKDKINAARRKYYATPAGREKILAKNKRYYQKHKLTIDNDTN